MDYGILVRIGEVIVRTGELRPPESFSYTINGTDVPDYEWLFEVIIWGLWTLFGYGGLKLLKVLLIGTTLFVLGWRLRREGFRAHGIFLTLALACLLTFPSWNLRPLFVTSIGLLLVSGWLHDHCTGRRPLTWWLPAVMLLWANLHPGVITGQGLLLGAIAWEWLNRWLKLNAPLSAAACWRLTLIGGLGLAATFVSPDPVGRLMVVFRPELRHPIQQIFIEMQPLHRWMLTHNGDGLQDYVLAAVVALTVVLRFRLYRLWEVALLTVLGLMASLAVRSVQDWVLIMLALGMPHLAALLAQAARAGRRRWWGYAYLRANRSCRDLLNSFLFRVQGHWLALAVGGVAAVSLTPPLCWYVPIGDNDGYPVHAADWIAADEDDPTSERPWRIFSSPDDGAYLVWRLGDRIRCYCDTRGFCYPPEFIADSQYVLLMSEEHNWRQRLQKVMDAGTEYYLLETQGGRGALWTVLRPHVGDPLYLDDKVALLTSEQVRRGLRQLDAAKMRQD
jgi:hypothetical protein